MARGFNLTAQLNLRGPSNIKTVVADIRREIGTIDANINLKFDPKVTGNISSLNSALKSLNSTLTASTSALNTTSAAMRNFGNSVNISNIKNFPQQVNNATSAVTKLGSSSSSASKDMSVATNQMQEFGNQSALAIRRFAAFTAVTTIIFGVTNAIGKGLQEIISFDKEMVTLQQITGESRAGLKGLSDNITLLATSLGVSSHELVDISSTLAQAGLSAKETEQAIKALALSSLAPSFSNMNDTVEGSIALMRQFNISAVQLEGALGSINSVAARFAVEASDIITAIQRTGGVFATASQGVSEGTDALNEFVAVFTSVRATTRESAETIATGLRTIFTRIQRGDTIDALKAYGVNLQDLDGKFVGAYKAVELLSRGLSGLDPRDVSFSKIIEELGGFRQIGKVIPLIQQFSVAQAALKVAQEGQGSLAKDATTAQLSLGNQMAKVREQFLALAKDIGSSVTFQTMIKGAIGLAGALVSVGNSIKGILPSLAILLAFKGAGAIAGFASGFFGGRGATKKQEGGRIMKFARGGFVPGTGDGDTVPAMLEPGEFVIRKKAVETLGAGNLHRMNKSGGGSVGRYAGGGTVQKFKEGGPFTVDRLQKDQRTAVAIGKTILGNNKRPLLENNDTVKANIIDIDKDTVPTPLSPSEIRIIKGMSPNINPKLLKSIRTTSGRTELVEAQHSESTSTKQMKNFGSLYGKIEKSWGEGYEKVIKARHLLIQASKSKTHPVDVFNPLTSKKDSGIDILNGDIGNWGEIKFKTAREPYDKLVGKLLAKRIDEHKVGKYFTESETNRKDKDVDLGNLEYYSGRSGRGNTKSSHKQQFYKSLYTGGEIQQLGIGGVAKAKMTEAKIPLRDMYRRLANEGRLNGTGITDKDFVSRVPNKHDDVMNRLVIESFAAETAHAQKAIKGSELFGLVGLIGKTKHTSLGPEMINGKSIYTKIGMLSEKTSARLQKEMASGNATSTKNLAESMQAEEFLGSGGNLAIDFDETLVSGADIFNNKGLPDIEKYFDMKAVAEALQNAKLKSPIGTHLKEVLAGDPKFIEKIRVLSARPQTSAALIAATLNRLGIPIGADRVTGVSSPGMTSEGVATAKAKNLGYDEALIDDNLQNILAARKANKTAHHLTPVADLSEEELAITGKAEMEGYTVQQILTRLGAPAATKEAKSMDFPKGLGSVAQFFGIEDNIPTDVKRTIDSTSIGKYRAEVLSFLENRDGAFGAKDSKVAKTSVKDAASVAKRNVGYIDSDVLANPANARIVGTEMAKLGISKISDYKMHLSKLAATARNEGSLDRLSAITGVAGSGKSSLMLGGSKSSKADNASLRQTTRNPILTAEDIASVSQVIDVTATVSPERLSEHLTSADKVYSLSSSTKEEREEIKRRRDSRDVTGNNLFGRNAGVTAGAPTDSGSIEGMLASEIDKKKLRTLGITSAGFKRKMGPTAETKKIAAIKGGFAPTTRGHQSIRDAAQAMGFSIEDFVVLVGSNEGITGKDPDAHAFRTVNFDQDFRTILAKAAFSKSIVNKADPGFGMPDIFEGNPSESGRRHFVRPGPGSVYMASGKTEDQLQKYKDKGYTIGEMKKRTTVEGSNQEISGTATRAAILSGDITAMRKFLSPAVFDIVQKNLTQLQNREKVLPEIMAGVKSRKDLSLASIDKELATLPSRIDRKKMDIDPAYKIIGDQVDALRAHKKKVESQASFEPFALMRKLAEEFPEKYGLSLTGGKASLGDTVDLQQSVQAKSPSITPGITSSAKPIKRGIGGGIPKLGKEVYDLQKAAGLSNFEFDQAKKFGDTMGYGIPEFKTYLAKIIEQKKSKAGMKTDSKALLESLKEPGKTSTSAQLALAAKLKGPSDAAYTPTPSLAEDMASVNRITRGYAIGGAATDTVPALLTPGEFVINKKAAESIGYGQLRRMNHADKIQGFAKGGSVGNIQKFADGDYVFSDTISKSSVAAEAAMATFMAKLVDEITAATPGISPEEANKQATEQMTGPVNFGLLPAAEAGDQDAAKAVYDAQRKQVVAITKELRSIDSGMPISEARIAAEAKVSEAWSGLMTKVKSVPVPEDNMISASGLDEKSLAGPGGAKTLKTLKSTKAESLGNIIKLPEAQIKNLEKSFADAGVKSSQYAALVAKGGNITFSAAMKAIDGDIKRAKAAGTSVKTIADLEDKLSDVRKQGAEAILHAMNVKENQPTLMSRTGDAFTSMGKGISNSSTGKFFTPAAKGLGKIGTGLEGQVGFMIAAGLGIASQHGEKIFGKKDSSKEAAAGNAAIESSVGTASAGIALASQVAIIPVVGPALAGIVAVGTAALVAADYFGDFTGAQKAAIEAFEQETRDKRISEAGSKLSASFDKLQKDVNNVDLQRLNTSNMVATSNELSTNTEAKVSQEANKTTRNWLDIATGNFAGTKVGIDRKQIEKIAGADANSEIAQKNAQSARFEIKRRLDKGESLEDISKSDKGKALAKMMSEADAEANTKVAGLRQASKENPAIKAQNDAAIEAIQMQALRNDGENKANETTGVMERAHKAAALAGQKLSDSFESMAQKINQAVNSTVFSLDAMSVADQAYIDGLGGKGKVGAFKSESLDVLNNPKAYSRERVERANYEAANMLGGGEATKKAASIANLGNSLNTSTSAAVKKAAGTNSDIDLEAGIKIAKAEGIKEIKNSGATEEDQALLITQFEKELEAIQKKLEESAKGKDGTVNLQELNNEIQNATKLVGDGAAKSLAETNKTILAFREGVLNRFNDSVNQASDKLQEAFNYQQKAIEIISSTTRQINEIKTGSKEGYTEVAIRQKESTARLTGGVTDPTGIRKQIEYLNEKREGQQAKLTAATQKANETAGALGPQAKASATEKSTAEANNQAMADQAIALSATNRELDNNQKALENLANSAEAAAAALAEMQNVKNLQQQSIDQTKKLLSSTPEDAKKLQESFARLQNNINGVSNSARNSSAAQKAFADEFKSSGNIYKANKAGQAALAQDRGFDLQNFQENKSNIELDLRNKQADVILQARKTNSDITPEEEQKLLESKGLTNSNISKKMRDQEANLLEAQGRESGIDTSAAVKRLRDPSSDSAMVYTEQNAIKAAEVQAQANKELANLNTSMADLTNAIDRLNNSIPMLQSKVGLEENLKVLPPIAPTTVAKGGLIYASAGQLVNFQPKGTDTVPAMLTPGEFVVNRASTEKHLSLLQSINKSKGGVVYLKDGGEAEEKPRRGRREIQDKIDSEKTEAQSIRETVTARTEAYNAPNNEERMQDEEKARGIVDAEITANARSQISVGPSGKNDDDSYRHRQAEYMAKQRLEKTADVTTGRTGTVWEDLTDDQRKELTDKERPGVDSLISSYKEKPWTYEDAYKEFQGALDARIDQGSAMGRKRSSYSTEGERARLDSIDYNSNQRYAVYANMGDDDRTTDRSLLNDLDLVENKQNNTNTGRIANDAENNALRDAGIPEKALGYKPGSGVEYSQDGVNLTQRIREEQAKPDFEARAEKQRVVLQEKEKQLARARLVAENITIPEIPAATVQPAAVAPSKSTRGDLDIISKARAEKSKAEAPPAAIAPAVPTVQPAVVVPTAPPAAPPAVSPAVSPAVVASVPSAPVPAAPSAVASGPDWVGYDNAMSLLAPAVRKAQTARQTARQTQTAQRIAKIDSLNLNIEDQAKYTNFQSIGYRALSDGERNEFRGLHMKGIRIQHQKNREMLGLRYFQNTPAGRQEAADAREEALSAGLAEQLRGAIKFNKETAGKPPGADMNIPLALRGTLNLGRRNAGPSPSDDNERLGLMRLRPEDRTPEQEIRLSRLKLQYQNHKSGVSDLESESLKNQAKFHKERIESSHEAQEKSYKFFRDKYLIGTNEDGSNKYSDDMGPNATAIIQNYESGNLEKKHTAEKSHIEFTNNKIQEEAKAKAVAETIISEKLAAEDKDRRDRATAQREVDTANRLKQAEENKKSQEAAAAEQQAKQDQLQAQQQAQQPPIGQPFTGQPSTGQPSTGQPPTGQPPTGQPNPANPKLWVNSNNWLYKGMGYFGGLGEAAGNVAYGAANVAAGAIVAGGATLASPLINSMSGYDAERAKGLALDEQIKANQAKQFAEGHLFAAGSTETLASAQAKVADTGPSAAMAAAGVGVKAMAQGAYTAVEAAQAVAGMGPVMTGEQTAIAKGDAERRQQAKEVGGGVGEFVTAFGQNAGYAASQGVQIAMGFGASSGTSILGRAAKGLSAVDNLMTNPGTILGGARSLLGMSGKAANVASNIVGGAAKTGTGVAQAIINPVANVVKSVAKAATRVSNATGVTKVGNMLGVPKIAAAVAKPFRGIYDAFTSVGAGTIKGVNNVGSAAAGGINAAGRAGQSGLGAVAGVAGDVINGVKQTRAARAIADAIAPFKQVGIDTMDTANALWRSVTNPIAKGVGKVVNPIAKGVNKIADNIPIVKSIKKYVNNRSRLASLKAAATKNDTTSGSVDARKFIDDVMDQRAKDQVLKANDTAAQARLADPDRIARRARMKAEGLAKQKSMRDATTATPASSVTSPKANSGPIEVPGIDKAFEDMRAANTAAAKVARAKVAAEAAAAKVARAKVAAEAAAAKVARAKVAAEAAAAKVARAKVAAAKGATPPKPQENAAIQAQVESISSGRTKVENPSPSPAAGINRDKLSDQLSGKEATIYDMFGIEPGTVLTEKQITKIQGQGGMLFNIAINKENEPLMKMFNTDIEMLRSPEVMEFYNKGLKMGYSHFDMRRAFKGQHQAIPFNEGILRDARKDLDPKNLKLSTYVGDITSDYGKDALKTRQEADASLAAYQVKRAEKAARKAAKEAAATLPKPSVSASKPVAAVKPPVATSSPVAPAASGMPKPKVSPSPTAAKPKPSVATSSPVKPASAPVTPKTSTSIPKSPTNDVDRLADLEAQIGTLRSQEKKGILARMTGRAVDNTDQIKGLQNQKNSLLRKQEVRKQREVATQALPSAKQKIAGRRFDDADIESVKTGSEGNSTQYEQQYYRQWNEIIDLKVAQEYRSRDMTYHGKGIPGISSLARDIQEASFIKAQQISTSLVNGNQTRAGQNYGGFNTVSETMQNSGFSNRVSPSSVGVEYLKPQKDFSIHMNMQTKKKEITIFGRDEGGRPGSALYSVPFEEDPGLSKRLTDAGYTEHSGQLDLKSGRVDISELYQSPTHKNKGGIVYAANGALMAAQSRGTDTVPAMLTPGEFVVNREASQKHAPILQAINSGHYDHGGMVNYLNNGGIATTKYFSRGDVVTEDLEKLNEKRRNNDGVSNNGGSGGGISDQLASLEKRFQSFDTSIASLGEHMGKLETSVGSFGEHSASMSDAVNRFGIAANTVPQPRENIISGNLVTSLDVKHHGLGQMAPALENMILTNSNDQLNQLNRLQEGSLFPGDANATIGKNQQGYA